MLGPGGRSSRQSLAQLPGDCVSLSLVEDRADCLVHLEHPFTHLVTRPLSTIIMVPKPWPRAWLLLGLGLLSFNLTLVSSQSPPTSAPEGDGTAAAKYTCSKTKKCEIGCCGSV